MRTTHLVLTLSMLSLSSACGDADDAGDDDAPLGGSLTVSGRVVDFQTGDMVSGATTVSTSGLSPSPSVTVDGAWFTVDGVPANSTFHLLAASAPDHRATYGVTVSVAEADLEEVKAQTLSEAYLASLETGFGVTASAGKGVLLARVVGSGGQPRAGVEAGAFVLDGSAGLAGPFFLDESLAPAPGLTATSASGWVVFFEVAPGLAVVTAAAGSDYTMDMPVAPVAASAATLAQIIVLDGVPPPPVNVSFAADVVPIFAARGCDACHSGGGIGKDLGGLVLDGGNVKIYRELREEISPNHGVVRVDIAEPEMSLLLTLPSPEIPADAHPNVTFASAGDPDYQIILAWITAGAPNN